MIEALRTPDDRFLNLPGFGFAPHYLNDLDGYERLRLRMERLSRTALGHLAKQATNTD